MGTGCGQPVPLWCCVWALAQLGSVDLVCRAYCKLLPSLKGAGGSRGHAVQILQLASESDYFFFLEDVCQLG